MRSIDRAIFSDTARTLGVWILVRGTNPESCRYIGSQDCVGKPFEIKAKTADRDVGNHRVGGLVADPTDPLLQGAFSPAKLSKAVQLWRELLHERPTLAGGGASGPYRVVNDPASPFHGCLTRDGKYIHGDFDLYDIVDPARPTSNLGLVRTRVPSPGSTMSGTDITPRRWSEVARLVNSRVGKVMIHHGGDMQWVDRHKKEGHADDSVEAFGPNREHVILEGTRSIAAFYGNRFPNRKSLRQSY